MRDFRRCTEAEAWGREAQQQVDRKLIWFHDKDGSLVIKAMLPAEVGRILISNRSACEEIPEAETPMDVSAATPNVKWRIHPSARKVDALALMAETFLAQGAAALNGGDRHQRSKDLRDIPRVASLSDRLREFALGVTRQLDVQCRLHQFRRHGGSAAE